MAGKLALGQLADRAEIPQPAGAGQTGLTVQDGSTPARDLSGLSDAAAHKRIRCEHPVACILEDAHSDGLSGKAGGCFADGHCSPRAYLRMRRRLALLISTMSVCTSA